MRLTGIHLLLTYRCTDECDHCFLWGSPWGTGTMTLAQVYDVLNQAEELGTVDTVYFEGGEPFLFYPIMLAGLRQAKHKGFKTGIVSNCYWARSVEDALAWLEPIAQIGLDDLSLSSDLFHGAEMMTASARNAITAARQLGLPEDVIAIEAPEGCTACPSKTKGEPVTGGQVRFRGRAAEKLTSGVELHPWTEFTECPDEDFLDLGRLHVDAFGHLHACQGLVIGNVWQKSLKDILAAYDPQRHPIIGPLLAGGPAGLVQHYGLDHAPAYADACHLCYTARNALRARFPEVLAPPQVYGDL